LGFLQVKLASLDFRTCGNNTRYFRSILNVYLQNSLTQLQSAKDFHTQCLSRKSSTHSSINMSSINSKCCVSLPRNFVKIKHHPICEYCVQKKSKDSATVCDIDIHPGVSSRWPISVFNWCSDLYQFYNINEHHSVCCEKDGFPFPPSFREHVSGEGRRNTDLFVINSDHFKVTQYLNKLSLQKSKFLPSLDNLSNYVTTFSDIHNGNITGLGCRTNKTVNFHYIDSSYHSAFMKKFNVNVPEQQSEVSVILADLKDEAVYVMKEQLNYRNLGMHVKCTLPKMLGFV